MAGSQPSANNVEDAEIRECREWIQSHSPAPQPRTALTRIVSPRTLCFDGSIYPGTVKEAAAWLDRVEAGRLVRPRLVVRSTGGDAGLAIEMTEKLQRHDAAVTVVDYCISSCANYFFAGLRRRRVTPGALLLFHGGYSPGDRRGTAEELDRASLDPDFARLIPDRGKWLADELKKYDSYMARQNALYRRIGVDPIVVTRMPSVDEKAIPAARCGARKGAERATLFFDKRQFRRIGIVIDSGQPAASPAEVDRRLSRFGFRHTACAVPAEFFAAH
jgi:hypothetical protein